GLRRPGDTLLVAGLVGYSASCAATAAGSKQVIPAAASHVRIRRLPEVLAFSPTIPDFLAPAHGRRDAAIPHNVEIRCVSRAQRKFWDAVGWSRHACLSSPSISEAPSPI